MSSRGAGRVYSGHVDRQAFKCMGHSKEGERLGCPVGRGGMVGRQLPIETGNMPDGPDSTSQEGSGRPQLRSSLEQLRACRGFGKIHKHGA